MASKASLDNMLQAILGFANQAQDMYYPPNIFSSQYNTVTSLLLSTLARQYPVNNGVVDMLMPFVNVAKIPVTNGMITLPGDYRNILGAPSITVKPDGSDCGESAPITNPIEFATAIAKGGCQRRPIVIVPQSEFDYATTSTYNFPTVNDPIGYFYGNKIKVCPYDLIRVELMYVRNEGIYQYGYITQPDDTYIFDPTTTVESEWESNAFEPIFKAMSALYAAFTRDPNMRDWAVILKTQGLF